MRIGIHAALLTFAVAALVFCPRGELAQTPPTTIHPLLTAHPRKFPDTATRGRWILGAQVGFSMEYGIDQHELSHISLLIAQPQAGFILKDFASSPIRRFELVNEGIIGTAINPRPARLLGDAIVLRLDSKEYGRWVPFFDAGLGAQYTTLARHVPEIDGSIQFTPQGGIGVQYFVAPQRAVVLEWRTVHMSNASLAPPNMGFNSSMLTVGFRWFRRPI